MIHGRTTAVFCNMVEKEKKDGRISLYSLYNRDMVTISIHRTQYSTDNKDKEMQNMRKRGSGMRSRWRRQEFCRVSDQPGGYWPTLSSHSQAGIQPNHLRCQCTNTLLLWPFTVLYFGQCLGLSSAYIELSLEKFSPSTGLLCTVQYGTYSAMVIHTTCPDWM